MRALLASCAVLLVAAPAAPADPIVVRTAAGTQVEVERSPLRITFRDAAGRAVLGEVAPGATPAQLAPVAQSQFGTISPAPPTAYAPLEFLVGSVQVGQFAVSQWQGDLTDVTTSGTLYGATAVAQETRTDTGVDLVLATDDPSGRTLRASIAPVGDAGAIRVSVRPSD